MSQESSPCTLFSTTCTDAEHTCPLLQREKVIMSTTLRLVRILQQDLLAILNSSAGRLQFNSYRPILGSFHH